ncbi:hypothetical protein ACOMHN_046157 [Nucella lapillus]
MAEDKTQNSWRLEKYIDALQDMLSQMKKATSRPAQEMLAEYNKKVEFLKGLVEVEKMPAGMEKAMAADRLQPVTSVPASAPARQLQSRAKKQTQDDMRQELLGAKGGLKILGVAQRAAPAGPEGGWGEDSDMDSLLMHHQRMQERLAEEMLAHTRALKQNITDAGRVVREDVKKLGDTMKTADGNYSRLQKNSERLEGYTKSCSWWLWIMLLCVIVTFLAMVVFMKIFPKS